MVEAVANKAKEAAAEGERGSYKASLNRFAEVEELDLGSVLSKWEAEKRKFKENFLEPASESESRAHPYYSTWVEALGGRLPRVDDAVSSPMPQKTPTAGLGMAETAFPHMPVEKLYYKKRCSESISKAASEKAELRLIQIDTDMRQLREESSFLTREIAELRNFVMFPRHSSSTDSAVFKFSSQL